MHPMRFSKRRASEHDVPFLMDLRRETMDPHLIASGIVPTDEMHLERLMVHFDCAEVILEDGQPIGLLKVQRLPGHWNVVQMQLSSRVQGRGLGRALLEELLAAAAAARVEVRLSVLKANPARRLYERLGLAVIGEDAHEYFMRSTGRDADQR